ncbi:helix-turn-helix domain-containing protein [Rhizobiales bacterium]|uniref:MerR family transcriptional regulator n=1 Tax=Hongsoonwoonella zoysiae TaxID=2821844 RepID=UPI00155FA436|nr:helix-turn-helix domain-containing protein [Hongsoonwoonella zoysiae]NRG19237.1 helix-turn-helix domain-containing protein [Hongsoonwoonella zoysiae]
MSAITKSNNLSIGALSEESGVKIETIRYYERIGIMPAPARRASGHRIYGREQAKRLSFIRRCRELGFSLEEIRTLLSLVDGGEQTCMGVHAIVHTHAASVKEKIRDLQRLASTLDAMAAKCAQGEVPYCPVIEDLFDGANNPSN